MKKFNQIKEVLSNRRYRALIILALYTFFFMFVAVYCRTVITKPTSSTKQEEVELTPEQKYGEMTNYEYVYTKITDGVEEKVLGTVYRNIYYLSINNKIYYVKDQSEIYEVIGDSFIISSLDSLYLITPSQIYNYIGAGSVVSRNEDYENEITSTKYKVSNSIFGVANNDYFTFITVYIKDKQVFKVELDVTEYINSLGNQVSSSIIDLEYSNYNGVSNFTTMFDESNVVKDEELSLWKQ